MNNNYCLGVNMSEEKPQTIFEDVVKKLRAEGKNNYDIEAFVNLATFLRAFDMSVFPNYSAIFAASGKATGPLVQYVFEPKIADGKKFEEGYYIFFEGASKRLSKEVVPMKHAIFDITKANLSSDINTPCGDLIPYNLSDLGVFYAAREVRRKIQKKKPVDMFKFGDASRIADGIDLADVCMTLSFMEGLYETSLTPEDFDAEFIGRLAASYVRGLYESKKEKPSEEKLKQFYAAIINAQPKNFLKY